MFSHKLRTWRNCLTNTSENFDADVVWEFFKFTRLMEGKTDYFHCKRCSCGPICFQERMEIFYLWIYITAVLPGFHIKQKSNCPFLNFKKFFRPRKVAPPYYTLNLHIIMHVKFACVVEILPLSSSELVWNRAIYVPLPEFGDSVFSSAHTFSSPSLYTFLPFYFLFSYLMLLLSCFLFSKGNDDGYSRSTKFQK